MVLSDTRCCALRVLLNIPVVQCVDRPSRSAAEQFRTQGSAHRTYYLLCILVVHLETPLCSVVNGAAVLSETNKTFLIARFVRF